jgi:hypothetical protein
VLVFKDCADKLVFPLQIFFPCELADTESGLMTSHCLQTDDFSRQIRRVGTVLSAFEHLGVAP